MQSFCDWTASTPASIEHKPSGTNSGMSSPIGTSSYQTEVDLRAASLVDGFTADGCA